MFPIHTEGRRLLTYLLVGLGLLVAFVFWRAPGFGWLAGVIALVFFLLILQFFRNPQRLVPVVDDNIIYAPADGKVVVIEEAEENEYFKDKRLQVSI
ncbi:MAG: phosphatidylserine decarboxylase, partial [Bacteroidota bacterium]